VECGLGDVVRRQLLAGTHPRTPVCSLSKPTRATPELRCLPAHALRGGRFNFFRGFGGEAISPVIGDRPIDDRSAVKTFPRIEDQEKVREPIQHHQSFALRATHNHFLPRDVNELARRTSNLRSSMTASHYQCLSPVGTTYTYNSVRSAVSIFNFVRQPDFGENKDGMALKRQIPPLLPLLPQSSSIYIC
jgi:hypothetical protein